MKYHIDTIPVWDALKEGCECPVCQIEAKTQDKYVDFYLGDSVMQPDVRQMINKKGFCHKHYSMMLNQKKKLALGLSCSTRLDTIIEDLDKYFDNILLEDKSYKKSRGTKCNEYILHTTSTCAVCDKIDENMKRYLYTFIHLWKTDEEFRNEFYSSKGLCLVHYAQLIEFCNKEMSDKVTLNFAQDLTRVQKKNLQRIAKEVKYFNDKFDHKNIDKPWGSAKDALPRAINKLSGHIIKS